MTTNPGFQDSPVIAFLMFVTLVIFIYAALEAKHDLPTKYCDDAEDPTRQQGPVRGSSASTAESW